MTRLWIRLMKHNRIAEQKTVSCPPGEERDCLREACREMDVPAPIWLNKNESEYGRFRRTAFTADNFVEGVGFDRLEIEFLDDAEKKRRGTDPRNASFEI